MTVFNNFVTPSGRPAVQEPEREQSILQMIKMIENAGAMQIKRRRQRASYG